MKILSALQIKEADSYTINSEPISSIDLMERAARACLFRIMSYLEQDTQTIIFCGSGNNGGDGLAIARLLADNNQKVTVCLLKTGNQATADQLQNLQNLKQQNLCSIQSINEKTQLEQLNLKNKLIIDAILGSGITRPADDIIKESIEYINANATAVISIDIPSGMIPDGDNSDNTIIIANKTLSFQFPKRAFMFPENQMYYGSFEIIDIGLNEAFIESIDCKNYFTEKNLIKQLLLYRQQSAHKGNFGHALLIAGSKGKIGAAELAGRACLRSGAGLLSIHIPNCGYSALQCNLPEAMISCSEEENFISDLPDISKYNVVGIGCGIGTERQTQNILKLLIQNSARPLVIDADAINILAENKTWLAFLPKFSILTPHPKEFDRLAGKHTSGFDRLQSAKDLSATYNVIIILKGMYTACVMPDGNVFFNSSGNSGLAKGGSGDTLTGIITGLLARGYAPNHAAIFGVFLHGFAADLALKKNHVESLLASDVIEKIPSAFRNIYNF